MGDITNNRNVTVSSLYVYVLLSISKIKITFNYILLFKILGFGVFATREYKKNEFIVEYASKSVSRKEGFKLEKSYENTEGSYLYFCGKYWYVIFI